VNWSLKQPTGSADIAEHALAIRRAAVFFQRRLKGGNV